MTSALSGKEICAIIQACAKAKVTCFTQGSLIISFEPIVKPDESWNELTPPTSGPTANSEPQTSNFNKQVTADVLNDLLLTDPVAYERYITGEEQLDDQN